MNNPKVGFVSLGCPKALVDSEQIITQLRAEGYEISPSYENSDLVVVNTCTGYVCPGLSTYLVERLDMPREIRAYDLVGAGCGGAACRARPSCLRGRQRPRLGGVVAKRPRGALQAVEATGSTR